MAMAGESKVICLLGPTACGKTSLALALAQRLPCDIISVDSAMVYRGMDIGTAKPARHTLAQTAHRLIDICDPAIAYSAGQFYRDAQREIKASHHKNRIPLLVGGTMLYFHLLQQGMTPLPAATPDVRRELTQMACRLGWPALHARLHAIDPTTATAIHPQDGQRIQRALEVYYTTGQTMAALRATSQPTSPLPYKLIHCIVDCPDRTELQRTIAQRFDHMLAAGLIAEVEKLYTRGDLHAHLPSMRSVGYRQVWHYLQGRYDYSTMRERAIIATRQLAKRQRTWLRRWRSAVSFAGTDANLHTKVYDHLLTNW